MDASLLTSSAFWLGSTLVAAEEFPGALPECASLCGHVLFGTSGSTGAPKWIALSKSALLASAVAVNRHLEVTETSCWGLALPSRHVGGFGVGARAFAAGCAWCALGGRWDAPAFVNWLGARRVSHTSLVPTQVHDLVSMHLRAPASLRAIVVGGGHLDAATGQRARALGWPVLASYGMTEAASQIATQRLEDLETIYQPEPLSLLPIWEATSTSPEHLLRIAGPALFSGWVARNGGQWEFVARETSWYDTQDRVKVIDGSLIVVGRADTLIKVLGELVDPEAIERELVVLSGGRLQPSGVVVVAVPDARAGHILVPVFEAAVDGSVIQEALRDYAGRARGPHRLGSPVMLESFALSAVGKPLRGQITAAVIAQVSGCH